MGTSNMYLGKNKHNTSLLPEDYLIDEETPIESWQAVKTYVTRNINSNGNYGSKEKAVSKYIKASGGSKNIINMSRSGKRAAINIGRLFNSINDNGYQYAFRQLGIDCVDKSVEEIFSELVCSISPEASTKEDVVAREATQEALAKLYDYLLENDLDLNCLDHIPNELIGVVFCEFIVSYLWVLILNDLSYRFEKNIEDGTSAYELQEEYKDIIRNVVDVEYENSSLDDLSPEEVIPYLMENCYDILEDY